MRRFLSRLSTQGSGLRNKTNCLEKVLGYSPSYKSLGNYTLVFLYSSLFIKFYQMEVQAIVLAVTNGLVSSGGIQEDLLVHNCMILVFIKVAFTLD